MGFKMCVRLQFMLLSYMWCAGKKTLEIWRPTVSLGIKKSGQKHTETHTHTRIGTSKTFMEMAADGNKHATSCVEREASERANGIEWSQCTAQSVQTVQLMNQSSCTDSKFQFHSIPLPRPTEDKRVRIEVSDPNTGGKTRRGKNMLWCELVLQRKLTFKANKNRCSTEKKNGMYAMVLVFDDKHNGPRTVWNWKEWKRERKKRFIRVNVDQTTKRLTKHNRRSVQTTEAADRVCVCIWMPAWLRRNENKN